MPIVKVGPKYQVTIPAKTRKAVGLEAGDYVEAKVERPGVITLYPKAVVDKRISTKKRLEAAEADVKAGQVLGPFSSAKAALRAVKRRARHARAPK